MNILFGNRSLSWPEYQIISAAEGNMQFDLSPFEHILEKDATYEGEPFDVVVLDADEDRLCVQLMLPCASLFDDGNKPWATSDIRKLLSSEEFAMRFSPWFADAVVPRMTMTDGILTKDRFWLLSLEETGFYMPKQSMFRAFDGSNLSRIRDFPLSEKLLANRPYYIWWLRSGWRGCDGRRAYAVNMDGWSTSLVPRTYCWCLPACVFTRE